MKRRDFLRNIGAGAALPLMLGGVRIGKASPLLDSLASLAAFEERVLILIQLNGGNDGLNTLIPLDGYAALARARSNVLVPEGALLKLHDSLGIHPSMSGLRQLWNDEKLGILHSVGYPDPNFSHFRSTDIWTSGSDADEVVPSGWLGRYLAQSFPDFPQGYPNAEHPDPLSITLGAITSTTCQGPVYSMGIAIQSADNFYELRPDEFTNDPGGFAGAHLNYIRTVISQTRGYVDSITGAAAKANNRSDLYPSANSLADQLKIAARLIAGGLQSKIYVCQLGGFDTHAGQVEAEGDVQGVHANLLQQVSEAITAFQDDLRLHGIEDKVLGLTFSEFGRRIASNGSLGTDHGTAAPLFVFGSMVNPMIHGVNPQIPDTVSVKDNLPMQFDFRSVYYSVLQDWFGVSTKDLQTIMRRQFQHLPIVKSGATSLREDQQLSTDMNLAAFPNPFGASTRIEFSCDDGYHELALYDQRGSRRDVLFGRHLPAGVHEFVYRADNLPAGQWYLRLQGPHSTALLPVQHLA